MSKFTKCLITKSEDLFPLKGYENNYLVKSKSSGFVFCSNIPSAEELINHYNNYPIGYSFNSEINRIRINERLDEFEKFRKTNKILDVGCGPGMFLIEAKKRGWEVFGTEFTDKQIDFLEQNGIGTHKGKLTSSSFDQNQFDVIISSEVIEHINNPVEEITYFNSFLRKGGLLYITTPNFNALERLILKGNWDVIEYPEHLSYYTKKTINLLLRSNGFKKMNATTTGISIDKIRKGRLKNDKKQTIEFQSKDQLIRESMEKGYRKYLKNLLNFLLNITGTGNSLKVWYIKK